MCKEDSRLAALEFYMLLQKTCASVLYINIHKLVASIVITRSNSFDMDYQTVLCL